MPSEKQSAKECIQYDTVFRIFSNKTKQYCLEIHTYLAKRQRKTKGGVNKIS